MVDTFFKNQYQFFFFPKKNSFVGAFRDYFRPLELWLINKNKELNEPIGWSTGTVIC